MADEAEASMSESGSFETEPLFDPEDYDPRKLRRRTDPWTSDAAARLLGGRAGSMRRRLLEVFARYPQGLIAEEAAALAGYGPGDGAWKRVSDLLNGALLRDSGRTRRASTGREQRVLVITVIGTQAVGNGSRE